MGGECVMTMEEQQKRLVWQCRRGIKEVEVLLVPFFDRRYAELSADDRILFERLLECQDADLFEWFTGRAESDDEHLARMVNDILRYLAG